MTSRFKSFTGHIVGKPQAHPIADQIGAFCYRHGARGIEVLLITSSRNRWILPKGWPMKNHTSAQVALEEAWEEAGVRDGVVSAEPVLRYNSTKLTKKKGVVFTRVAVHTIAVTKTDSAFPEADSRTTRWVTRREAEIIVCQEHLRDAIDTLFKHVATLA